MGGAWRYIRVRETVGGAWRYISVVTWFLWFVVFALSTTMSRDIKYLTNAIANTNTCTRTTTFARTLPGEPIAL